DQVRCKTGGLGISIEALRSGHLRSICNLFRKARNKARLPKELVLYCARHDYGTPVLIRTGNLAAVNENDGAPRRKDCDALSVPGIGNRARGARLPSAKL